MDSGTIAGIIVASSLGTIFVIGLGLKFKDNISAVFGSAGIGNWFRILYYFLPYSLFLFGVIYDGLIRKIKFFPAGFIGLGAVLISWGVSKLVARTAVIDTDICGLPGMTGIGSNLAPQNIVFASTVMSYIATYISVSQSDLQYSVAAWGGVGIVFALQVWSYISNNCYASKIKPDTAGVVVNRWILQLGGFGPPLVGLLLGGGLGALSGGLIAKYVGDDAGIGLSSEAKQSLTSGKSPVTAPTSSGGGKCSATDSDDQFVCEAYKNGELVTSTIVE